VIEIPFFVEAEALHKLCPDMKNVEVGLLKAFDVAKNRIHEVADKVYLRGQEGYFAYILTAEDF